MERLISIILIIVGLINLFPVVGVISAENLLNLYGMASLEGDLVILMRHRALLFGILGSFIIYSAFQRPYQPAAILMGMMSMLGFIFLLLVSDDYGAKLYKVGVIDAIACICLLFVAFLRFRSIKNA